MIYLSEQIDINIFGGTGERKEAKRDPRRGEGGDERGGRGREGREGTRGEGGDERGGRGREGREGGEEREGGGRDGEIVMEGGKR